MTEVDVVRPRDVAGVVANLLAALAVAAVFGSLVFSVVGGPPVYYSDVAAAFRLVELMPTIVVVVGVGLALVSALRRFGWVVAGLGLAGSAGLYLQGQSLNEALLYTAVGVTLGLQLGGVMLALGAASRPGRWALVIGFGLGVVAGRYAMAAVVDLLRAVSDSYADEIAIAALAVLTVVAGLLLAVRPEGQAPAGADAGPAARSWRAVIWLGVAVIVGRGLSIAWQAILTDIARSSTGGISQNRAEVVEALNAWIRLGIAVVIGVILLVEAYRRGGAGLARWVVVAFALATTGLAVPYSFGLGGITLQVLVPAVGGALLAAVAVRWLDRFLPWDAVGVLITAAALLVGSPRGQLELPELRGPFGLLLIFGTAFALTAGLARLVGPGRGLSAGEVGVSAGLGLAALVLGQQAIGGGRFFSMARLDSLQLDQVLTLAGAAVVLVLLFGLGLAVRAERGGRNGNARPWHTVPLARFRFTSCLRGAGDFRRGGSARGPWRPGDHERGPSTDEA